MARLSRYEDGGTKMKHEVTVTVTAERSCHSCAQEGAPEGSPHVLPRIAGRSCHNNCQRKGGKLLARGPQFHSAQIRSCWTFDNVHKRRPETGDNLQIGGSNRIVKKSRIIRLYSPWYLRSLSLKGPRVPERKQYQTLRVSQIGLLSEKLDNSPLAFDGVLLLITVPPSVSMTSPVVKWNCFSGSSASSTRSSPIYRHCRN